MPGGLQGLVSDGDNLRKQLQTDDPSSPANALSTLVQWWSDWRARQATEADPTNPPVGLSAPGGGLSGLMAGAMRKPVPVVTAEELAAALSRRTAAHADMDAAIARLNEGWNAGGSPDGRTGVVPQGNIRIDPEWASAWKAATQADAIVQRAAKQRRSGTTP